MRHVAQIYSTNWRYEFGFASCLILTPDGQHPLGLVGASKDEDTFLDVMVTALERNKALAAAKRKIARGDPTGWQDVRALVADVQREVASRRADLLQEARQAGRH